MKKRYVNSKRDLEGLEDIDYEAVERELDKRKEASLKEFGRAAGDDGK